MGKSGHILGIDVGASGIKGAIVDTDTGKLLTERLRVDTPQPATPKAVTRAFKELIGQFSYSGDTVGVGFPAITQRGVAQSAANIHADWIGTSIEKIWSKAIGKQVYALNDADAAGLASVTFGTAKEEEGTVVFLTLGTGIGSAIFLNGKLVPNSELGHIYMPNGMKSEHYASNRTRKNQELSWETWGKRLDEVLHQVIRILSPEVILLGGGVSKHFNEFSGYFTVDVPVEPAMFRNQAGAVGAALYGRVKRDAKKKLDKK